MRVDLIEVEHVCSSASKRWKFRKEFSVGALSTRSVPFIIIPMKEGEHSIEVKAAVKDSSLNDGIRKMLRVVVREIMHSAFRISWISRNCVCVCVGVLHTRHLRPWELLCILEYILKCLCVFQPTGVLVKASKVIILEPNKRGEFSLYSTITPTISNLKKSKCRQSHVE